VVQSNPLLATRNHRMTDRTQAETPADTIHRLSVGPIVDALTRPTIDVGGCTADVLNLLESVAATVMALAAVPEGHSHALVTFSTNVSRKLAMARLASSTPAGSG
jgi:hypothetical protein